MLANMLRTMRLRAGSKAIAVAIAAATLVVLAGGWASAAEDALPKVLPADGRQPGSAEASQRQLAAPQTVATLPTGLVLATRQSLAELSLRGNLSTTAHSATGGGWTQFFGFGFTARSHRNGKVAGSVTGYAGVVFGAPNPGALQINLNCLVVVGNEAYVSGTLTKAAFGLSKGTEMLFGVLDDESAGKADLISDIYFSPTPAYTCHTFHAKPRYVVHGRIELH